jgi:hypothetical protein
MGVAEIVQLLITFGPAGIDLVEKLIAKFEQGGPVTSAEWVEMRKAGEQTSKDRMIAVLIKAGADLNSDQAKALIAAAS